MPFASETWSSARVAFPNPDSSDAKVQYSGARWSGLISTDYDRKGMEKAVSGRFLAS